MLWKRGNIIARSTPLFKSYLTLLFRRINQDLAAEARQLRLLSTKKSGSLEPEGADQQAWFSSGEPIGSPAYNSREDGKGGDSRQVHIYVTIFSREC